VEITYGNARYPGSIAAISPEVRNGQVTGRVRFKGEPPADLRQNQRVSVRVVLEEKADALMVDRGASYETGGGRIAYVMDGQVARRQPIRTGSTSLGKVEIVEVLTEGQSIVISGSVLIRS
jgi:HlyD family secretion protein